MSTYLRLLRFVKPHLAIFTVAVACMLFSSLLGGIQLGALFPLADRIITDQSIPSPEWLPLWLLGLVDWLNGLERLSLLLWFAIGERRALLPLLPPLAPAVLGAAIWAWAGRGVEGFGPTVFAPFGERLAAFGDAVLGGYRGVSEEILLTGFAGVFAVLSFRALPWSRARWSA